jgi:acetyl-CoA carboxylase biotin carboxyl carrier protein
VADEASETPGPFDVKTIRLLVALMSRNDLSEIDLRNGEQRIRLRRGPHQTVLPPALFPPIPAAPLAPSSPTAPGAGEPSADAAKPAAKSTIPIKSPTPGTFYSAPKPGALPFAQVGTRVTPTTVVCMIEAMKLFNEITADCTGIISEVLVENQQPVEYGQVLFNVDPTA